ncbi:MAG: ABC transporter permease, partial [Acidimicrobiia bacterium]|nr:ABC transporter permease [Acidimicrobiia bacterium]
MTDVSVTPPGGPTIEETEGLSVEPITQWKLFRARFGRHRLAMVSLLVLAVIVVLALAAPLLPINSPYELQRDAGGRVLENIAPRADFPLGTDDIGRDVLARVVHGGRASLAVAGITGLLVATLGTVVGSLAGFYPGAVDQALMRLVDIILGLPLLPVAIVAGRIFQEIDWLPEGPLPIGLLLGILLWGSLSRIVRAEFLSLREKEFVEAARAAGANDRRIIFRHILPNAMSPIIVQTTLVVGAAII